MPTAIRRLLDEVSWEGNAVKYRGGGLGLENVLTTEVFQALDFLPRDAFLGEILRRCHGAEDARLHAADDAEAMVYDNLAGDLEMADGKIRAQPDGLLISDRTFVMIEAKRIRRGVGFQPEQLAREIMLAKEHAHGRRTLLLLVLSTPPPVLVKGHGRYDLRGACELSAELVRQRTGLEPALPPTDSVVAWTTWSQIKVGVTEALDTFEVNDVSAGRSVRRMATSLIDSIAAHGGL